MNKAEALEASIAHWEENARARVPSDASLGVTNCALCKLYHDNFCQGCPVYEETGKDRCSGTPFQRAYRLLCVWRSEDRLDAVGRRAEEFRAAAQEEVDFLKSLRPVKVSIWRRLLG